MDKKLIKSIWNGNCFKDGDNYFRFIEDLNLEKLKENCKSDNPVYYTEDNYDMPYCKHFAVNLETQEIVDVDLDHEVEEITTEDLPELMRNEDTLGLSFLLQDMVLDPKNMPTGTVTSVGVDCGTYIGTYVVDSSYSQCKCGQNVRPCGDTLESGHGPFLCCGEWK